MAKTYIERLIDSLDKDKQKVDWTCFVDNFPKDEADINRALDDLAMHDEFLWMESLRMTYIAVEEIENQIEFTESIVDDTLAFAVISHNTIFNLRSTQNRIIGRWINNIVANHDFEKGLE